MERFDWHGYKVEVDLESTRAWYEQAKPWGCTCGHCRNFLATADRLPEEMRAILKELSIPPEKTTDLSELYHENGTLHYMASYRVVGRVLERPDQTKWHGLACRDDPDSLYPYGAVGFPQPCFDLTFCPDLPWVLDEPLEGG